MSRLKRFLTFTVALCMISAGAYAETKEASNKAAVEIENLSVVEESFTSDTDYSDLYVNFLQDLLPKTSVQVLTGTRTVKL